MVQSTLKSTLQTGLGKLGSALGITKADGSAQNPFYVRLANGGMAPLVGNGAGGGVLRLPPLFSGSAGGGIFNFSGGMAEGGYPTPGESYLVGEQGPEILTGMSGRIMSNAASRRALGSVSSTGTVINNIDARGADLGAGNRVARALEMSHRSAISTAVRASREHSLRTPGGK
jgi:hypothetical protein